jgi:DNA-directed RNA polymerase subunit RPC12/RpoP
MIDRMGNAPLTKKMCMVCGRKLFLKFMVETRVDQIPNRRHLVPLTPHPAHVLVGPWLLHDEAMEESITYLCIQCKKKLARGERPQFALANNMWIGRVPFELSILTLPERMLVVLYFPAVYILKLYPKRRGAREWDENTMSKGMKGNVSTYRLSPSQIAGIVSGNKMPPPPRILAATIGVTFVGVGNCPLSVLLDFLRVCWQRVFDALLWLKQNNRLYSQIDISAEQLRLLPVNAVPEEIMTNTRYSGDVAGLEREQARYIPLDAEDEEPLEDVVMGMLRYMLPTGFFI